MFFRQVLLHNCLRVRRFRTVVDGNAHVFRLDDHLFDRVGSPSVAAVHFLFIEIASNLLGASDGFGLNSEFGRMMIHFFGIIDDLFIQSLKQKVRRGIVGAIERGTSMASRRSVTPWHPFATKLAGRRSRLTVSRLC